jgi:hypothetical protein
MLPSALLLSSRLPSFLGSYLLRGCLIRGLRPGSGIKSPSPGPDLEPFRSKDPGPWGRIWESSPRLGSETGPGLPASCGGYFSLREGRPGFEPRALCKGFVLLNFARGDYVRCSNRDPKQTCQRYCLFRNRPQVSPKRPQRQDAAYNALIQLLTTQVFMFPKHYGTAK